MNNQIFPKIRPPKKIKPLGATSPWVYSIEPVNGCNLRCGHCSRRLNEPGKYLFMSEQTWRTAWAIHARFVPTTRVDLCVSGEPTLHPDLYNFLKIARATSPLAQIQITTNGTMLRKGVYDLRRLFDAGANIVYVDMYGPHEEFVAMAQASGIPWYEYYDRPSGAPSPWNYSGPDLKIVVLMEQPENWPKSRFRAGLLGTWYNHLDWEAAKRFGLSPVTKPIERRCNQPFLFSTINYNGDFLLCCQDNWGETAGAFGNVSDGAKEFPRYWYHKEMQIIRRRLREKNRAGTTYCSRCCWTASRCDFKHWTDEQVSIWWDGSAWRSIDPNDQGVHQP